MKDILLKYLEPPFVCTVVLLLLISAIIVYRSHEQRNSKGYITCDTPTEVSCYFNSLIAKNVIYEVVCTDDRIYYVPIDKCDVQLYNTKDQK